MFSKKRDFVLTLIAAIVGAIFGGLWGKVWGSVANVEAIHIVVTTGIASGFLACFSMSVVFLRRMEKRGQQIRFSLGALFGLLAGALAGVVTGASLALSESHRDILQLIFELVFLIIVGAIWGGINGVIIGLISTSFVISIPPFFRARISGTELNKNIAGMICYLGLWVTGVIYIVIGRGNKFVRFHAIQSTIVFGSLTIIWIVLGFLPDTLSLGGLHIYNSPWILRIPLTIITGILWLILMILAYNGRRNKLPWAGNIADKYA